MANGINMQAFVGGTIGAVIVTVIVITVAIPILTANQVSSDVPNADAINSMINIIPLLLVVAVIIAIVGMFLYRKSRA